MATYNAVTDRTKVDALVPPELADEIIKSSTQKSMALNLFRRMPVITNSKTIPVMDALPYAYWINPADTGLQQTTSLTWKHVHMNIEELGVIAPMPRSVVEDVASGGINLTQESVPYIAEAAGVLIDLAAFFGVGKPASWPDDVQTGALAAGNTFSRETTSASKGGLAEDINQLMRLIALGGFRPTGLAARSTFEYDLDGARDVNGQKLLDIQNNTYRGRPISYGGDGVFPEDTGGITDMFALDASKFIIGIRRDMEFTVHTEGVITNDDGKVIYNLMQQNGIAIRLTMRLGFAVGNPVTRAQSDSTKRYPAGVLLSPAQ